MPPLITAAESPVPVDVLPAWEDRLRSALDGVDPRLAEDVLGYLVRGDPAELTHALTSRPAAAVADLAVRLLGHPAHGEFIPGGGYREIPTVRPPDVYSDLDRLPPAVGLRWAVLISALPAQLNFARMGLLRLPPEWGWLEHLLDHALGTALWCAREGVEFTGPSLTAIRRLLTHVGAGPDDLLTALMNCPEPPYPPRTPIHLYRGVTVWPGWEQLLLDTDDTLRRMLGRAQRPRSWRLVQLRLDLLGTAPDEVLVRCAAELADLASSGTRSTRTMAQALLDRIGAPGVQALLSSADTVPARQRADLLNLVWERDVEGRPALFVRVAADRSAQVRALARAWTRASTETGVRQGRGPVAAPAVTWAPQIEALIEALCVQIDAAEDAVQQKYPQYDRPRRLDDTDRAELRACVAGPDLVCTRPSWGRNSYRMSELIRTLPGDDVPAVAVLKLLGHVGGGMIDRERDTLDGGVAQTVEWLRVGRGGPDPFELADWMAPIGATPETFLVTWISRYGAGPPGDAGRYLAAHPDLLIRYLRHPVPGQWWIHRPTLFEILRSAPELPARVVEELFSMATGSAKEDRASAQQVLTGRAGTPQQVVSALGHRRSAVRAAAAEWLGRLGSADAVPALEAALAAESQVAAKNAFHDALERLRGPVPGVVAGPDRADLAAEAAAHLARPRPASVDWLDGSQLPALRWAAGGAVPPDVLQGMVLHAARQRSAQPDAMVREFARQLKPADREQLGDRLLSLWIGQDLERAEDDPPGTALASKGLLALAGSCAGGENAAAVVRDYLDTHYGLRSHQSKALLAMLAWVDHPSAVQVLLAVTRRFRTPGIQSQGTRLMHEVAQRRGWTVDELSDRTVPTAGLGDDCTLCLDLGPRRFSAVLSPQLTLLIRDERGRDLPGLPPARAGDDAVLAEAARRTVSATRKDLKRIVPAQVQRLHEAMCGQRTWPASTWQDVVLAHPVLRPLACRVVWSVLDLDGVVVATFRPLEDGGLTDVEDGPVTLDKDARVTPAHGSLLEPGIAQAWAAHLADYLIVPLFDQLGRPVPDALPELPQAHRLPEVHGHLTTAYRLRGQATRLGYQRGPNDGAWFSSYHKRFPGLGLTAVIDFSGNRLPEENRTVALSGIQVHGTAGPTAIQQVPPVLLAELRADIWELAGAGEGRPDDWRERVGGAV